MKLPRSFASLCRKSAPKTVENSAAFALFPPSTHHLLNLRTRFRRRHRGLFPCLFEEPARPASLARLTYALDLRLRRRGRSAKLSRQVEIQNEKSGQNENSGEIRVLGPAVVQPRDSVGKRGNRGELRLLRQQLECGRVAGLHVWQPHYAQQRNVPGRRNGAARPGGTHAYAAEPRAG